MAEWNLPYRFNVYGVGFDVTFESLSAPLICGDPQWFGITLAFARKTGELKTLAVKTILNPKDKYNYQLGQRKAFERLVNLVWASWGMPTKLRKDFSAMAWGIAFSAGLWE